MMKFFKWCFGAVVCGLCVSLVMNFVLVVRVARVRAEVDLLRVEHAVEMDALKAEMSDRHRKTSAQLEVERRNLYAAYRSEETDFSDSHRMMGGGRISYAMYCNALEDFNGQWQTVATNWFFSTARSDVERRLMRDYQVSVSDLGYSRDDLLKVMYAWKSVRSGRGRFNGQDVVFRDGVASYTNAEYACSMELTLRKKDIWVYEGNVYLFAIADVAGNDSYGASDSLLETWFLRFKGGRIADCCHFRHGCDAFDDLRYHFEPVNDTVVITSTKTGDIAGELGLGLREYTDAKGKRTHSFGYSESMVTNHKTQK